MITIDNKLIHHQFGTHARGGNQLAIALMERYRDAESIAVRTGSSVPVLRAEYAIAFEAMGELMDTADDVKQKPNDYSITVDEMCRKVDESSRALMESLDASIRRMNGRRLGRASSLSAYVESMQNGM